MLDGHEDLALPAAQVQIAVPPGVQFGRSSERLARPRGAALSGMVDEYHGGLEAALQVSQEAEDGGDFGDGVLVDAVQAHQGVEDDEAGRDALHGLAEALAVGAVVEAEDRNVDDGDVEGLERGPVRGRYRTAASDAAP